MKLTADRIKRERLLHTPGKHSDGNGLWLQVVHAERASWVLRFKSPKTGKTRELGLGRYRDVTPTEARHKAAEMRVAIRKGRDPVAERRQEELLLPQSGMTVREAAEAYIKSQIMIWRSPKSETQWRSTLARYVYPSLGDTLCQAVTRSQVRAILEPIWEALTVTASRIRGRIQSILGYAASVEGWVNHAANWKDGLQHLLADPKKKRVRHHAALPFEETGKFWGQLKASQGVSARALEFVVLTAARSRPVRLATWSEIDFEKKIWTCPEAHMKAGAEFRVPLTDAALALLRSMAPLGKGETSLIFPGLAGRPISENSMQAVLHRMGCEATVHGFRSTFRDWAAESTDVQSDVAEVALDHNLRGGPTRSAYQRGDLLDKRRTLMDDWCTRMTAA